MPDDPTPRVPESDREAMRRQSRALAQEELRDEGDAQWEASVVAWADAERAASGRPPLVPWWETKTEPELHRRARSLGLLG